MKQEKDAKPASIRKMKFMPKKPTRPKKPVFIIESSNIKQEPSDTELLQHIKTAQKDGGMGRRMPKTEAKANVEKVSFGATTSYATFGAFGSYTGASSSKVDKEKVYKEPWDGDSNYPITLPLRRRDQGDPQILDEEEFGETTASLFATGTELDPASKLGLNVKSESSQMIFFQFPAVLPFSKPNTQASSSRGAKKGCKLSELPRGKMGKLLVYKSGKVKMQFGDILFDVHPGSECKFSQEVAAVNVKEKQYSVIGQLGEERAIVTPDFGSMLDSMNVETKM